MSSLIPFSDPGGLSPRQSRSLERQIALTHARASLTAAKQVAKLNVITEVTEEALLRGSEVANLTGLLIERTPNAERALSQIASAGIAAMGNVVIRTGRNL